MKKITYHFHFITCEKSLSQKFGACKDAEETIRFFGGNPYHVPLCLDIHTAQHFCLVREATAPCDIYVKCAAYKSTHLLTYLTT